MLDSLSQRLSKIVKTMRGQARLTEENTKDMLREVRIALLEADVALPVVREVLARIKEKAMGEEVVGNFNPVQAMVGVVGGGRAGGPGGRPAAGGSRRRPNRRAPNGSRAPSARSRSRLPLPPSTMPDASSSTCSSSTRPAVWPSTRR